jgi:hypothetical protein
MGGGATQQNVEEKEEALRANTVGTPSLLSKAPLS